MVTHSRDSDLIIIFTENIFQRFIEEKISRPRYLYGINFGRIKLAEMLQPAQLSANPQMFLSMSCCAYGWGTTENGWSKTGNGRLSMPLKQVKLQILNRQRCINYATNYNIQNKVPNVFNRLVRIKTISWIKKYEIMLRTFVLEV